MPVRKIAYLDTMLFLHYPLFTDFREWDWKRLVGAEEVELAVSRITYYEIDNHKDHGLSAVKKRARKAATTIENLIGDDEMVVIGDGVWLSVSTDKPRNFDQYDLDPTVPDDELILAALNRKEREGDAAEVVIVSGDSPVRTKARRKGIVPVVPSAPRFDDKSDHDREMEELKRRIARTEAASPRLVVVHEGREDVFVRKSPFVSISEEEFVAERLSKFREELPYLSTSSIILSDMVNETSRIRYNNELEKFFDGIKRYCGEAYRRNLDWMYILPLTLVLENIGGRPASQISVTLSVRDGAYLVDLEKDRQGFEKPQPPSEPVNRPGLDNIHINQAYGITQSYSVITTSHDLMPRERWESPWKIGPEGKYIFKAQSLVQHTTLELPRIGVHLQDPTVTQEFGVNVRIVCAEMMNPKEIYIKCRHEPLSEDETNPLNSTDLFEFLENARAECLTPNEEAEASE